MPSPFVDTLLRFPQPAQGVDINTCRDPKCPHFGMPARSERARGTRGPDGYNRDKRVEGVLLIECLHCGASVVVKSNEGVAQERDRILAPLIDNSGCCPTPGCVHNRSPVGTPGCYVRHTATKGGSPRWKCKACLKPFTPDAGNSSLSRQDYPEINHLVFKTFCNKMPVRGILNTFDVWDIDAKLLYKRLDFFAKRCTEFSARHERPLLLGRPLPAMRIEVDRQVYTLNWSKRKDRRNVTFEAVGACDSETGYVLAMVLNYDGTVDQEAIEKDAQNLGESEIPYAYRKYARFWLASDYDDTVRTGRRARKAAERAKKRGLPNELKRDPVAAVTAVYEELAERVDSEQAFAPDVDSEAAPSQGMQIHSEYTLAGTMYALETMLRGSPQLTFNCDQESGLRGAFLSAFRERVRDRTANAFYVQSAKELTVPEREAAVLVKEAAIAAAHERYPGLSDHEVRLAMVREARAEMSDIGPWNDRWLKHPLPSKGEPSKMVCWLTDLPGQTETEVDEMYLAATLHNIDKFFMVLRRKLSYLERPIRTRLGYSTNVWNGYSPYNPRWAETALNIYKTYYNYTVAGEDGLTPAQRIGLADRCYNVTDLLGMDPVIKIDVDIAA